MLRGTALRLNYAYYMTKCINPALDRVLSLGGARVLDWFKTLARPKLRLRHLNYDALSLHANKSAGEASFALPLYHVPFIVMMSSSCSASNQSITLHTIILTQEVSITPRRHRRRLRPQWTSTPSRACVKCVVGTRCPCVCCVDRVWSSRAPPSPCCCTDCDTWPSKSSPSQGYAATAPSFPKRARFS